jgi:hypothetical protein
MNMTAFIDSLQLQLSDLENVGEVGYIEGISSIIIKNLNAMDVTERPIHCTDKKREIIYVKDENKWDKESQGNPKLRKAIKHVAHKNMKQIREWTKTHPEYNDSDSRQNDKYLKIVSESMSGSSQEETNKNYLKIIKNIVKETVINK